MAIGNLFEHLPRVLPEGEVRVEDESHTFVVQNTTKYVYLLDKAPVEAVESITGTYNGSTYEFVKGVDYQVIDDNNDGKLDSIDWNIGSKQPDDNSEFVVTYRAESIISRYIDEHETEIEATDVKIDEVISSRQVDNASGDDLDRIGAIFGELGRRRGRPDNEYRSFIKSIVQSFSGRGTVPGLKFAIAAGVGISEDEIDDKIIIEEDFVQVGYRIKILNVDTNFITGAISDLADIADPSGVELLQPPVIVSVAKNIDVVGTSSEVVQSEVGLGGSTLNLDGTKQLGGDGFTWDDDDWDEHYWQQ